MYEGKSGLNALKPTTQNRNCTACSRQGIENDGSAKYLTLPLPIHREERTGSEKK
jgi:hypothetical protein